MKILLDFTDFLIDSYKLPKMNDIIKSTDKKKFLEENYEKKFYIEFINYLLFSNWLQ